MPVYNFYIGSGNHSSLCCRCVTDGHGHISSASSTSGSGSGLFSGTTNEGQTSLEVGFSHGTDSSSEVVCYTITDITNMYNEIIQVIIDNEIRAFVPSILIDEDKLLETVMNELDFEYYYADSNDSDDLFGYSDVLSLSSNSTFSIDNVKENFEDIMRNLHATRTYLDSANF